MRTNVDLDITSNCVKSGSLIWNNYGRIWFLMMVHSFLAQRNEDDSRRLDRRRLITLMSSVDCS